ncbi:MAG: phage holin family protein [Solirubrobacterales bacterium]
MSGPQGPNPHETALAQAIRRVTEDTQGLVRDQIDLAKLELQQKASVFGRGTAIGVAAGVFIVGALLLIIEGLSWMAWYFLFPDDAFFLGFFLVALILIILGVIAGLLAAKALRKAKAPIPDDALAAARQTQETFSEEAHLLREQVKEAVTVPEEERPQ